MARRGRPSKKCNLTMFGRDGKVDIVETQGPTPEKMDVCVHGNLPDCDIPTPGSSSSKKRGRPKKKDFCGSRSSSTESSTDETRMKIQKVGKDLDFSNILIEDMKVDQRNSEKIAPVQRKGMGVKGLKGFQKRSSAVRALFSPSQELMPPPIVTNPAMTIPILTPVQDLAVPINDSTIPVTDPILSQVDRSANFLLLQKILGESLLSDMDFPNFGETPYLTGCGLAAYLSYLCSITDTKCIAVHPNFSGNLYAERVGSQEMQSSNFLINPKSHGIQSVAVVFIPILLQSEKFGSLSDLEKSVGHWVLAIYQVSERKIFCFDPFGKPFDNRARGIVRKTLNTLPPEISPTHFSYVDLNNLHFNTQPFFDYQNCGYFVCLYAEMNIIRNFSGYFILKNFDISVYRERVLNIIIALHNSMYPEYYSIENLFSEPKNGQDTQMEEKIIVDMTEKVSSVHIDGGAVDGGQTNIATSSTTTKAKTSKPTPIKKLPKLYETCQKSNHPGKHCASRDVQHLIEYYDSGAFNYTCTDCGAKLLQSEYYGRASKCCHNGTVQLRALYDTLQHPPKPLLDLCTKDKPNASQFMKDARRYNTEFAFASIHTVSEKAPPGGPQMCKINGESSFNLSDLYTKDGKRPAFGQFYVLEHDAAMNIRNERPPHMQLNFTILETLDKMIREHNVLAKSYQFASELHKAKIIEYMSRHQQAPQFQMTLLTNREARDLNVADGEVHSHRTDMPTCEQVAVVWISKSGEPPNFSGIRLYGRAGRFEEMPYFNPNVDPACFPLLFPYGTQGYHYGIDKSLENKEFQQELAHDFEAGKNDGDMYFDGDVEWEDDFENAEDNGMDNIAKKYSKKRDKVSAREYYRYLFQFREDNPKDYHWLWTKRTLAELFVIITCNKIEKHEMDWVRSVQDATNLRSALPGAFIEGIKKGLKNGETLGRVYLAPPIWTGSRAYMQQQYADAKAMSRELGAPVWFLTFTGNPNWPEIKEALAPGQNYTSRPDIVCRIFYHKLKELIKDIAERHVLGKCLGYFYSVEFQKRGMPHIHMLIILEKNPETKTATFCDEFVCAEIPDLPDKNDTSPQAQQARTLHERVTKLNLHDHDEKAPCMENGKCKKYFPKQISPVTILSEKDFPIYKRRPPPGPDEIRCADVHGNTFVKVSKDGKNRQLLDNQNVVPYNPTLMLKYNTHLNLEHVGAQGSMEYACKYVMKGHDMAYVKVQKKDDKGNKETVTDYDEMAHAFKCRYMTAIEAYWRLNGYPIVHKSHRVIRQWVYGPEGAPIVFHEGYEREAQAEANVKGKKNMVQAFFDLCQKNPLAKTLTYDKLGKHFYFNRQDRIWVPRKRGNPNKIIVRVGSVSPVNRDLFCIRILLLNRPGPTSFQDLRTVDGKIFETFEAACEKLDLLDNDDMWVRTLNDASLERMGCRSFRKFFAQLIYHCLPAKPLALLEYFVDKIIGPNLHTGNKETDIQTALRLLQYLFVQWNTSCEMMGLPKALNFDPKKVEEEMRMPDIVRQLLGMDQDLNQVEPPPPDYKEEDKENRRLMNKEQLQCFTEVQRAIIQSDDPNYNGQRLFLLHGSGGTGKTFVYNALITWCKSKDRVAIACASTGIAARLLSGGQTAHSTFGIMNDIGPNQPSNMPFESPLADKLRSASLFIIDEISMLHRNVFEYIDRVMQSIQYRDTLLQPFGGKVFLIGGDFKQLLPVVPSGCLQDQIYASLKSSPLYDLFKRFDLIQNMRVDKDEKEFTEYLEQVGNGTNFVERTNFILIPKKMKLLKRQDLIDFCFPKELLKDPVTYIDSFSNAAILAPTNTAVELINLQVLGMMAGEERIYTSIDSLNIAGDNDSLAAHNVGGLQLNVGDNVLEMIHERMPTGLPPHKLHLKVGAIVMLIKNLNVTDGLCNGTRLQIVSLGDNLLRCRVLSNDGPADNPIVLIPRIKFTHGTSPYSRDTAFTRTQFPVRLSFAMTINKSQGQTLSKMGLCLDCQDVFSHGQLYVALSRVRRADSIRIVSSPYPKNYLLMNIVLHEFL